MNLPADKSYMNDIVYYLLIYLSAIIIIMTQCHKIISLEFDIYGGVTLTELSIIYD